MKELAERLEMQEILLGNKSQSLQIAENQLRSLRTSIQMKTNEENYLTAHQHMKAVANGTVATVFTLHRNVKKQ